MNSNRVVGSAPTVNQLPAKDPQRCAIPKKQKITSYSVIICYNTYIENETKGQCNSRVWSVKSILKKAFGVRLQERTHWCVPAHFHTNAHRKTEARSWSQPTKRRVIGGVRNFKRCRLKTPITSLVCFSRTIHLTDKPWNAVGYPRIRICSCAGIQQFYKNFH